MIAIAIVIMAGMTVIMIIGVHAAGQAQKDDGPSKL